jgi:hypothetical protein
MSRFCATCDIGFPISHEVCVVCGSKLVTDFHRRTDVDWQTKVADIKIEAAPEDPVIKWRFGQLLRAEMPPRQALEVATRRDIDLHLACDLTQKAGFAQALAILL